MFDVNLAYWEHLSLGDVNESFRGDFCSLLDEIFCHMSNTQIFSDCCVSSYADLNISFSQIYVDILNTPSQGVLLLKCYELRPTVNSSFILPFAYGVSMLRTGTCSFM